MVQVSDQDMNTHLAEISRVRGSGSTPKGPPWGSRLYCRVKGVVPRGEAVGLAAVCD